MLLDDAENEAMPFDDLVTRYGSSDATIILKALERFEGIREDYVKGLSNEERLRNVFRVMSENLQYQTRH
jgi:hypothetical protein